MTGNAVEVKGMTKIYSPAFKKQRVDALKNVSLEIKKGQIFGLLGPNGAGKTTLIKILLGITHRTGGEGYILERPINDMKIKEKIGYLPENHRYPLFFTGKEVLKFFGRLSGAEGKNLDGRIDYLLELVKMSKWKNVKVKKYSKGMMQRLGLAQALINDPELVFLDEPTDGVDPIGRKEIREVLMDLKNQGKTIFVNSHLLSEVELISDRVAILNHGELIREGTVEDLTTRKNIYTISTDKSIPEETVQSLPENFEVSKIKESKYSLRVEDVKTLNSFIDILRKKEIDIVSINPEKSTLEDMFINLIKSSPEAK